MIYPDLELIMPESLPRYCLCASTCAFKEINALTVGAQRILNYIIPCQNTRAKALFALEIIIHKSHTCLGVTVTKATWM